MYTCAYIFTSYLHFKHLAEFGIYVRNSIYETAVTFCAQNRAEFKIMYYEKNVLTKQMQQLNMLFYIYHISEMRYIC